MEEVHVQCVGQLETQGEKIVTLCLTYDRKKKSYLTAGEENEMHKFISL
jgi:hypothetical protein